jgi:hypothetical protein
MPLVIGQKARLLTGKFNVNSLVRWEIQLGDNIRHSRVPRYIDIHAAL